MKEQTFEEALVRLEEIVNRLEQGELSLDESLALFEEGIKLTNYCNGKLEEAEGKIQVLLQREGKRIIKSWEEGEKQ